MAADDRRGDARSRLTGVAARLLTEHGPGAVTTRGVAEAAGVQAPTIYRLFGDKDGLLDAVAEHVMATHTAAKAAAAAADDAGPDADPVAELREGWMAQVDFGLAHPDVFRLLSEPERVRRSPAARAGRELLRARVRRVAEVGRLGASEDRAVDLVQASAIGTIQVLLATEPDERSSDLREDAWCALVQQVLVDAPAASAPGPLAAAVALRALAPQLTALTEAERALLAQWLDRVVDDLARLTPPGA